MSKRKTSTSKRVLTKGSFAPPSNDLVRHSASLSASSDLQRLGFQYSRESQGINFGSASNTRRLSEASSGDSLLSSLLRTASSGGIKSILGGGVVGLLSGSLFSGLAGLFGGEDNGPAPLQSFKLADSQNRSLDRAAIAAAKQPSMRPATLYGQPLYSNQNQEIVKAVKNALLTSPQLSDIISEL